MYPNSIYFGPKVPIYRDDFEAKGYTIWVHGPLGHWVITTLKAALGSRRWGLFAVPKT